MSGRWAERNPLTRWSEQFSDIYCGSRREAQGVFSRFCNIPQSLTVSELILQLKGRMFEDAEFEAEQKSICGKDEAKER